MEKQTDQGIADRLDILIKLTALNLCEGKIQREKIELLASGGLQAKVIADLLGTTSNTVAVTLSKLRKK